MTALFPVSGRTLFLASTVFATQNYVLRDGQIGVESDTGKMKIGDGVTEWADLEYVPLAGGDVADLPVVDAAAAQAGTDETPGLVSAKVLHDEVARQISEALDNGGAD